MPDEANRGVRGRSATAWRDEGAERTMSSSTRSNASEIEQRFGVAGHDGIAIRRPRRVPALIGTDEVARGQAKLLARPAARMNTSRAVYGGIWRRESESNRRPRLCRPLHDHSAIPPGNGRGRKCAHLRPKTKGRACRTLSPRIWSGKRVSNSRPQPWQGCALPTELFPRRVQIIASGYPGSSASSRHATTVPIASATYSMFFEFSAATQIRPVSTA